MPKDPGGCRDRPAAGSKLLRGSSLRSRSMVEDSCAFPCPVRSSQSQVANSAKPSFSPMRPAAHADRVPTTGARFHRRPSAGPALYRRAWRLRLEGGRIVDVMMAVQARRVERIRADLAPRCGSSIRAGRARVRPAISRLSTKFQRGDLPQDPSVSSLADVHGRQVARHRLALLPAVDRGGTVVVRGPAGVRSRPRPCRWDLRRTGRSPCRSGGRCTETGRRPCRLGGDEGAVVGGDPADLPEQRLLGRLRCRRNAVDSKALALRQRSGGPHDELLAAAAEACLRPPTRSDGCAVPGSRG